MTPADSARFTPLCREVQLREGSGLPFVVEGRSVALFRNSGRLHAVSGRCPHNGQSLHDGCVQGNVLTCRWHGWRFDLITGRPPDGPADGPRLRVYEVRVQEGWIEVAPRD